MTRGLWMLVAVASLTACQDWPDPVITQVAPEQMVASESTPLEISARLPFKTAVDYGEGTISVDTELELTIGSLEVPVLGISPEGIISTQVPTLLDPGSYDVRLTLSDGRTAVREGGLTVVAGAWPDGYTIDPIGPQQVLVPFNITVRATGPNGPSFRGNVRLEGNGLGPKISGAFVDGVLTQRVTMNSIRQTETISVVDQVGHGGTSAPFELR